MALLSYVRVTTRPRCNLRGQDSLLHLSQSRAGAHARARRVSYSSCAGCMYSAAPRVPHCACQICAYSHYKGLASWLCCPRLPHNSQGEFRTPPPDGCDSQCRRICTAPERATVSLAGRADSNASWTADHTLAMMAEAVGVPARIRPKSPGRLCWKRAQTSTFIGNAGDV